MIRTQITSTPLQDGKPIPKKPLSWGDWALALALLIFGGIGWAAGGKYTIDGWHAGLTMFVRFLGAPFALPRPSGWLLLLLIAIVGVIYSRVELLIWRASSRKQVLFWIGWLLVVLTDVGSTLLG